MRILHTSDWHLGRMLYGKKRTDEFQAFFEWLLATLEAEKVDVLLVAGDVFDTTTPGNKAQGLYYGFLCRVAETGCRHVVIVGGNHDSASFLDAPKRLLGFLNVHVIGAATSDPEDELLTLRDARGMPELLVCAVPFLKDRDLRTYEAGENLEDKNRKVVEGIAAHYRDIASLALQARSACDTAVPIVATGHLFVRGGKTTDGDGVRDLYVGSLAHVGLDVFPRCFDYMALGHLHTPQEVEGSEFVRYSGSPLSMSFGEASRSKSVALVDLGPEEPRVTLKEVPVFRKLERITGDLEAIDARIGELRLEGEPVWLEIVYRGTARISELRERLETAVAGSELEILRIKNTSAFSNAMAGSAEAEALDELSVFDVFTRCMESCSVPEKERDELLSAYKETVASLNAEDCESE